MNIKVTPYLFFDNCCEEALTFYQEILGGEFTISQRYDNGVFEVPETLQNKVLHAFGDFGGNNFFASDNMDVNKEKRAVNIALSLHFDSSEISEDIFQKLSSGGKVHVPFTKQFWGAWHGNFTDRFGIRWMVNCD